MIYLTSDTHFYHENIIKFAGRPFNDQHHMNKSMIDNWNSVITDNDIVIHLGDVTFGNFNNTKHIIDQLKGYKILVKGNHDHSKNWMLKLGFNRVYKHLYFKNTKFGRLLLIHNPDDPKTFEYDFDYVLHGHIHEGVTNRSNFINLCVEHTNHTPVKINEIFKKG
jgi:calcineurin-like phosphoesterase family protein